jgi:hypothetical protein
MARMDTHKHETNFAFLYTVGCPTGKEKECGNGIASVFGRSLAARGVRAAPSGRPPAARTRLVAAGEVAHGHERGELVGQHPHLPVAAVREPGIIKLITSATRRISGKGLRRSSCFRRELFDAISFLESGKWRAIGD